MDVTALDCDGCGGCSLGSERVAGTADMERLGMLGQVVRTRTECLFLSQLQDVDRWKICRGFVGFESPVLLEGRSLRGIEAGFDPCEEFESAGLKGFRDLLKEVSVGPNLLFCAVCFE